MKSFIKKLMGTKTYPDIKSIKPFTKIEGVPKYQKEIIKARGNVQKKFGSVNEGIKNETRQLRNVLQKMRGEKVTKSGISKGKDVTPGVYKPLKDKKKTDLATGGRVGRKLGGGMDMTRRKTNVEKIKETFSPKKSAAKNKNLKPVDKKKNPGLAKLPIEVRNKMGYAKKGGRA